VDHDFTLLVCFFRSSLSFGSFFSFFGVIGLKEGCISPSMSLTS